LLTLTLRVDRPDLALDKPGRIDEMVATFWQVLLLGYSISDRTMVV